MKTAVVYSTVSILFIISCIVIFTFSIPIGIITMIMGITKARKATDEQEDIEACTDFSLGMVILILGTLIFNGSL